MNTFHQYCAALILTLCAFTAGSSLSAQTFQWTRLPGIPTGEAKIVGGGRGSFFGQTFVTEGITRSTNGGATWDAPVVGLEKQQGSSFLVVGSTMYIGSTSGLFYSKDDGATWVQVQSEVTSGGIMHITARDSLLIMFRGRGVDGNAVIWSVDGGKTWEERNVPERRIYGIAMVDSGLFALGSSTLYRSTDTGSTWTPLYDISAFSITGTGSALLVTKKDQFIARSIDGGASWTEVGWFAQLAWNFCYSDSSILLPTLEVLLESTDQGKSWREVLLHRKIMSAARTGSAYVVATYYSVTRTKADIGVRHSTDNGNTWKRTLSPGISSQVDFLGTAGTTLFAQSGDPLFRSTDGGLTWDETNLQVTGVTGITQAGGALLLASRTGIYRSTDDGATWRESNAGLPVDESGPHLYDIIMHGSTIFTITGTEIYRSTNMGERWERSDNGIGIGNPGYTYLARFGSSLFAGSGAALFRSTDNGDNWTQVGGDFSEGKKIVRVLPVDSTLVAVTRAGVYRSADHGSTWIRANNIGWGDTLPRFAITVGAKLVVSGYNWVTVSSDYGATWNVEELPNYRLTPNIQALCYVDGAVYVGTRNTGLVRGVSSLLSVDDAGRHDAYIECLPNPVSDILSIRYVVEKPSRVALTIVDVLGNIVGTIAGASGEPGEQMVKFDVGALAPGIYFCRMQAGDRQHTVPVVVR